MNWKLLLVWGVLWGCDDGGASGGDGPVGTADGALDRGPSDGHMADAQTDARPSDARPGDARPSDAQPSDAQPGDAQPSDAQPGDAQPSDARIADGAPPDGGGAPDFTACTETTPSAASCKDCCDCLPGAMCDDATLCRQTCDQLPPAHWADRGQLPPFVPEVVEGPGGDYGACLGEASEQACKACCCGEVCGDTRFCRDACAAHDFGEPPPPDGAAAARCEVIRRSVTEAGFGARVAVDCDGEQAWLRSDIFPDHDLMNGITGSNEQIPVPAAYAAPVRLVPAMAPAPTTIDAALGVAVNGVPIFDYSSQGAIDLDRYDPAVDVVVQGQLDVCNGHAGRGDDYHYHAAPTCMMQAMANPGDGAILGWGFDGYPLFGFRRPDGRALAPGDLDVCNGMADETFGYRYHTTVEPPYVFQCLRGVVPDPLPRVPPLEDPDTRERRPTGRPPQGGVQGLRFVRQDGGAEMTYTWQGQPYFIRYVPVEPAGCYRFESDTVTSGAQQRVYCRAN